MMRQYLLKWKTVSILLVGVSFVVMSGCGSSNGNPNITHPINPTLTSVSITPSDPSIAVGATQQFKATATYSDGSTKDVTTSSSWSSSDTSEATIQTSGDASPGLAAATKAGSPNIQAAFQGLTALTVLDITSNTAQTGLALAQIDPSIAPGATLPLIAVASYVDGSTQTVTTSANWSSSDTSKASVGANTGLVTGVAQGSTTITATLNGFPASTTVTVASNAATIPLMDMTASGQNYLGFKGGLYGNNSDTVPSGHDADGKAAASAILPRLQNGTVDKTNGVVVFLGIGMSNATIEFSTLINTAMTDSKVNHTNLAIENGAHGAVTACPWTVAQGLAGPVCGASGVPAENQYDRVRDTVLATATGAPHVPPGCGTTSSPCLTEAQVQVIWMKNANPEPGINLFRSMSSSTNCAAEGSTPTTEACLYEQQMGKIVRAAKSRYPNLKQIFLSTRIYAGYAPKPLNPEPYAYEYGFSGQWLVEAQMNQVNNGAGIDPVAGNMDYTTGAWTAWSSYLWANGTAPRSDGLIWCNAQPGAPCNGEQDFEPDGTHPSSDNPGHDGASKIVSGQSGSQFKGLMGFFKTSPYTAKWFCASGSACGP
jgi:uncharacterized protein YjdB